MAVQISTVGATSGAAPTSTCIDYYRDTATFCLPIFYCCSDPVLTKSVLETNSLDHIRDHLKVWTIQLPVVVSSEV